MAAPCDPGPGEAPKACFPSFLSQGLPRPMRFLDFHQKYVATHRILAVLLDEIGMLRDNINNKRVTMPRENVGVRSVVRTGDWQKPRESAVRCRW